jgi:hypothetical protein
VHAQIFNDKLKKSINVAIKIGKNEYNSILDASLDVAAPPDRKRSRYNLRAAENVAPNVNGTTPQNIDWYTLGKKCSKNLNMIILINVPKIATIITCLVIFLICKDISIRFMWCL